MQTRKLGPRLVATGGTLLLLAAAGARAEGLTNLAPDIRPEALKDFRQRMPFKTIDAPKLVPAAEASFLQDSDYVLGITLVGESRAYPTRFIWWHHGVNDRIGDVPYAVTYCNVCNTGIGYDLRLERKERPLDFYGLYNGVVALMDRESGSVFLQAEGRYVSGELQGARLKHVPVLDTTWGQWKKLHPATKVMSPDTPFKEFYTPLGRTPARGNERLAPMFSQTITRGDLRLSPFEKVLGVALPAASEGGKADYRAYPLKAVTDAGNVVNDTAGDEAVVVFVEPSTRTAVAASRKLEGRTLTFEAKPGAGGEPQFFDKETGSRWNIEGRAEAGPLAGKQLTSLAGNLSQWYGWSAYFPQTSIYGRTDAPQPGDPFAAERGAAAPQKAQ